MANKYMMMAANEAKNGMLRGDGGPFGAVIVRNGEVIACEHNNVLASNDPTAHAEITAIRVACKQLGTYTLSDCVMYSSAEPCPMCRGAILWSGIRKVYYGCNYDDTNAIGFADLTFDKDKSILKMIELDRPTCMEAFNLFMEKKDKIIY